jgi:hypothetical protein
METVQNFDVMSDKLSIDEICTYILNSPKTDYGDICNIFTIASNKKITSTMII